MKNSLPLRFLVGLIGLLCFSPGHAAQSSGPMAAIGKFDFISKSRADKKVSELERLKGTQSDEDYLRSTAWAYLASRRPEMALPWFDRLIALKLHYAEDYMARAFALFQVGRLEEARADCFMSRFNVKDEYDTKRKAGWYAGRDSGYIRGLVSTMKREFKTKSPSPDQCLAYEALSRVSRAFYYEFIQTDPHVDTPELTSFNSSDPYITGFLWRDLRPNIPEGTDRFGLRVPSHVNPDAVRIITRIRDHSPIGHKVYDQLLDYFGRQDTRAVVALQPKDADYYRGHASALMRQYFSRCNPYSDKASYDSASFVHPDYESQRRGPFGDSRVKENMDRDRADLDSALSALETAIRLSPDNKEYLEYRQYVRVNIKIQRKAEEYYSNDQSRRELGSVLFGAAFIAMWATAEDREALEKYQSKPEGR